MRRINSLVSTSYKKKLVLRDFLTEKSLSFAKTGSCPVTGHLRKGDGDECYLSKCPIEKECGNVGNRLIEWANKQGRPELDKILGLIHLP